MLELCLTITSSFAFMANFEEELEKLARGEAALDRAHIATNARIALENVLGTSSKTRISDWTSDAALEHFPVKREAAWADVEEKEPEPVSRELQIGTGPAPKELMTEEGLKHRERTIHSLINVPLWNKAEWQGVGFIQSHPPYHPPGLSLIFKNRRAGRLIFSQWRSKFKQGHYIDEKDVIRVTIITGIDQDNPHHYRVLLSINPQFKPSDEMRQFILVSRVHTLTPPTSKNLDNFMKDYETHKVYCILPAHLPDASQPPDVFMDLAILKQAINIRPAWQIGENDLDSFGIKPDDKVVIPSDVKDAPVLKVLEQKQKWPQEFRQTP